MASTGGPLFECKTAERWPVLGRVFPACAGIDPAVIWYDPLAGRCAPLMFGSTTQNPTARRPAPSKNGDSADSRLAAAGLTGVRVYRTDYEVFGVERTVLVIWNQALFDAQFRTLIHGN